MGYRPRLARRWRFGLEVSYFGVLPVRPQRAEELVHVDGATVGTSQESVPGPPEGRAGADHPCPRVTSARVAENPRGAIMAVAPSISQEYGRKVVVFNRKVNKIHLRVHVAPRVGDPIRVCAGGSFGASLIHEMSQRVREGLCCGIRYHRNQDQVHRAESEGSLTRGSFDTIFRCPALRFRFATGPGSIRSEM